MKQLLRILPLVVGFVWFFLLPATQPNVYAADFRSGKTVTIPEYQTNLKDLYLFGGTITVDSPVNNDLVVAGGDITINKDISGSVLVAGGTINLEGPVGNTARIAGGNIKIDSHVTRDLIVSGGEVVVSKNASVGGDIAFSGGEFTLDGPVKGNVTLRGGNVTINSPINGNVNAQIGTLTLGPSAKINGSLTYASENKATVSNGAVVAGKTSFTQKKEPEGRHAEAFITAGTIYKLAADIIISILLIYFFARGLTVILTRMITKPVENGAVGFGFLFLFPIVAFIAFILIWLGFASLIAYGLILLISIFLVKIFLGWWILRWWEKRNKKTYILDWKAGLLGPIVLFLLAAIPVIGWIAAALILFVATGALVQEIFLLMKGQHVTTQKTIVARKKT